MRVRERSQLPSGSLKSTTPGHLEGTQPGVNTRHYLTGFDLPDKWKEDHVPLYIRCVLEYKGQGHKEEQYQLQVEGHNIQNTPEMSIFCAKFPDLEITDHPQRYKTIPRISQAHRRAPAGPSCLSLDITSFGLNFFACSLIFSLESASFSLILLGILIWRYFVN